MGDVAVEPFVLQQCGKNECNGFPLHIILKKYPARIDNLLAADPLEKLIFVLKMIIKGHSDHTGAIRDLLDRDLLDRLFKNQLFKALRKEDLHFPLLLQRLTPS